MLAALAGAALVMNTNIFQQNLTAGQGFIAVALVYFGAWRPERVMAGALLYGFVAAVVLQLKARELIPLEASDLAVHPDKPVRRQIVRRRRPWVPSTTTRGFIANPAIPCSAHISHTIIC